jgi:hypothetical protein
VCSSAYEVCGRVMKPLLSGLDAVGDLGNSLVASPARIRIASRVLHEGSVGGGRSGDEEAGAHAIGRSSGGERDGRGCRRPGPAVLAELPQQSNGPEEQARAEDLGAEGGWRGRMQSRMHMLQDHVENRARDGQEEDLKGKLAQIQLLRLELEAYSSGSSSIGYDSGDSTSHHSEHLENFPSKRRSFSDSPPKRLQAPTNQPRCTSSQGEA